MFSNMLEWYFWTYNLTQYKMKFFYLSSKPNTGGKFEVHDRECEHLPNALDRDYLGPFNNGKEAMRKAESLKTEVCVCPTCCVSNFQVIIKSIS